MPMQPTRAGRGRGVVFGLGCLSVTAGVILHVPMFAAGRDTHYLLTGMPFDPLMTLGMVLIGAGMVAVVVGVMPTREQRARRTGRPLRLEALDEVPIGRPHVLLMAVLTLAIAVDAEKPFTFTFILPGVAGEYGLSSPARPAPGHLAVALFPFVAIIGTVLGSLAWGLVSDRVGRRAAILVAATLFMATSICGAMPSYLLNLAMCFFMGLGVGGLLPISYALLTEALPPRRRGQMVVLVAGLGTGLGFLLTSAVASWLMPQFGWRIMWFMGLPTGLVLVLLNRWIPESPRFLAAHGRTHEAAAAMARFGVRLQPPAGADAGAPAGIAAAVPSAAAAPAGQVGARRLIRLTIALVLYGLGWGIVNFGFLTWLPIDLAGRSVSVAGITGILTNAALFSMPGALVVSWLYGRWSSKGTMVLVAILTGASLGVIALVGEGVAAHTAVLTALLVCLMVSLWGVIAVLAPYSAEVYPTRRRGGGAGVAAAASKLGGVLVLGMGVAGVTPPGLSGAGALTAAAMLVGAAAVARFGVETRRRGLEEISGSGGPAAPAPPAAR